MMKIFELFKGRSFSKKFKTQLIASFVIISFIILATVVVFIYFNVLNILKRQNEQSSIKMFRQSEYNINSLMKEADKITKLIIVDNDFQDIFNNDDNMDNQKIQITNNVFAKFSNFISNYDYIESIYVFEESGVIFGVSTLSHVFIQDTEKENDFFHSSLYKKADNAGLAMVWSGLYTVKDFDISGNHVYKNENKLITVARRIRPIGQGEKKATLVINIDEKKFTAVYNNSNENTDGSMYIINDSGIIISHSNDENIGVKCSYFQNIGATKQNGSITINKNHEAIQVVYYKLANSGWTLINEVPASILFKDIIRLTRIFVYVFFIGISVIFIISIYWIYRITRPLEILITAMKEMEKGKLGTTLKGLPKNELGMLGNQFNKMSLSIVELMQRNKLIEEEKRMREMEALQMQINPHFLYNTLNVIKWMAVVSNAGNVSDSLTILGNILKPIFKEPSLLCILREEVEYICNYLKIMNLRYSENIRVNINIPEEIMECRVLRFMLQPLIENSITHGISDVIHKLDITLSGYEHNGEVFINIEDNGKGMSEERLNEVNESLGSIGDRIPQIGLTNVNRRIKLNFGLEYGISIQSEYGIGSKVMIKIPGVQKS